MSEEWSPTEEERYLNMGEENWVPPNNYGEANQFLLYPNTTMFPSNDYGQTQTMGIFSPILDFPMELENQYDCGIFNQFPTNGGGDSAH